MLSLKKNIPTLTYQFLEIFSALSPLKKTFKMSTIKKPSVFLISILFTTILSQNLIADDLQSTESFKKGLDYSKSKEWKDAAKEFKAAELYADSFILKANALKKAANAYQKADLFYKEFECLKDLIKNFPGQINFDSTVLREYKIGNQYYKGYRERPYTWFPWIENDDHSIEIYEVVQQQSPYAKFMPDLLLKLGYLYTKKARNDEAIASYKKILQVYSKSKNAYIAYLDLSHLYLELAERGDGDSAYTKSARKTLQEFINKFPKSNEIKWAKISLQKTYELEAERLFKLADFYYDKGNSSASKRYIRDILINYPETKTVTKAEKLLNEIEMPLLTPKIVPSKPEKSKYAVKSLPKEEIDILVEPENSAGKWMCPIDKVSILENERTKVKYADKI